MAATPDNIPVATGSSTKSTSSGSVPMPSSSSPSSPSIATPAMPVAAVTGAPKPVAAVTGASTVELGKKETDLSPEAVAEAKIQLQAAAEAGDKKAQRELGFCYFRAEQGFLRNCRLAICWLIKAREESSLSERAEIDYTLGLIYLNGGEYVEQNVEMGAQLIISAANCDYSLAQYHYAILLSSGLLGKENSEIIKKNLEESNVWSLKAAKNGLLSAQKLVANYYLLGVHEFPQDRRQGVVWLTWASEQGDKEAQEQLAKIYRDSPRDRSGTVISKELAEDFLYARHLFCQIVDDYLSGAPENIRMGVSWLGVAAELGDMEAQRRMGIIYEKGHRKELPEGIQSDLIEARKWYSKAARKGDILSWDGLENLYRESMSASRALSSSSLSSSVDSAAAVTTTTGSSPEEILSTPASILYASALSLLRAGTSDASKNTVAIGLLQEVLNRGFAKAATVLGKALILGESLVCPFVPAESEMYLITGFTDIYKAAEMENPDDNAQYELGLAHLYGYIPAQFVSKKLDSKLLFTSSEFSMIAVNIWLEKAKQNGHKNAGLELEKLKSKNRKKQVLMSTELRKEARHDEDDPSKASHVISLYETAIAEGATDALYYLARYYGMHQNSKLRDMYLKQAVEAGDSRAVWANRQIEWYRELRDDNPREDIISNIVINSEQQLQTLAKSGEAEEAEEADRPAKPKKPVEPESGMDPAKSSTAEEEEPLFKELRDIIGLPKQDSKERVEDNTVARFVLNALFQFLTGFSKHPPAKHAKSDAKPLAINTIILRVPSHLFGFSERVRRDGLQMSAETVRKLYQFMKESYDPNPRKTFSWNTLLQQLFSYEPDYESFVAEQKSKAEVRQRKLEDAEAKREADRKKKKEEQEKDAEAKGIKEIPDRIETFKKKRKEIFDTYQALWTQFEKDERNIFERVLESVSRMEGQFTGMDSGLNKGLMKVLNSHSDDLKLLREVTEAIMGFKNSWAVDNERIIKHLSIIKQCCEQRGSKTIIKEGERLTVSNELFYIEGVVRSVEEECEKMKKCLAGLRVRAKRLEDEDVPEKEKYVGKQRRVVDKKGTLDKSDDEVLNILVNRIKTERDGLELSSKTRRLASEAEEQAEKEKRAAVAEAKAAMEKAAADTERLAKEAAAAKKAARLKAKLEGKSAKGKHIRNTPEDRAEKKRQQELEANRKRKEENRLKYSQERLKRYKKERNDARKELRAVQKYHKAKIAANEPESLVVLSTSSHFSPLVFTGIAKTLSAQHQVYRKHPREFIIEHFGDEGSGSTIVWELKHKRAALAFLFEILEHERKKLGDCPLGKVLKKLRNIIVHPEQMDDVLGKFKPEDARTLFRKLALGVFDFISRLDRDKFESEVDVVKAMNSPLLNAMIEHGNAMQALTSPAESGKEFDATLLVGVEPKQCAERIRQAYKDAEEFSGRAGMKRAKKLIVKVSNLKLNLRKSNIKRFKLLGSDAKRVLELERVLEACYIKNETYSRTGGYPWSGMYQQGLFCIMGRIFELCAARLKPLSSIFHNLNSVIIHPEYFSKLLSICLGSTPVADLQAANYEHRILMPIALKCIAFLKGDKTVTSEKELFGMMGLHFSRMARKCKQVLECIQKDDDKTIEKQLQALCVNAESFEENRIKYCGSRGYLAPEPSKEDVLVLDLALQHTLASMKVKMKTLEELPYKKQGILVDLAMQYTTGMLGSYISDMRKLAYQYGNKEAAEVYRNLPEPIQARANYYQKRGAKFRHGKERPEPPGCL